MWADVYQLVATTLSQLLLCARPVGLYSPMNPSICVPLVQRLSIFILKTGPWASVNTTSERKQHKERNVQ